jgi:TPR repeat protein
LASIGVTEPFEDAMAAYKRRDYAAALRLFRPLAEQGNAVAQADLGFMYYNGWGIPQNYSEALRWFRKAAAQGDASGQRGLGVMYFGGEGVRQSYSEAAKLFRSAADQGDAGAQNDLGAMYANGQGVPRSLVQAHVWFNIAASGSAMEKDEHDKAVRNRELVAKKMTAAQIAEAQRLATDRKGISQ